MGHALLGKLYKYTEPEILPLYDPNSDSDGVYKNKCLNSTAQKLVLPKKYSHSPNKTDQKWYTVISRYLLHTVFQICVKNVDIT